MKTIKITSDSVVANSTTITTADGQPVKGVRAIRLSATHDGTWNAELDVLVSDLAVTAEVDRLRHVGIVNGQARPLTVADIDQMILRLRKVRAQVESGIDVSSPPPLSELKPDDWFKKTVAGDINNEVKQ